MWRFWAFLKRINKEKWLKYICIVLACVGVLSYTAYHIASLFSEQISTIVVGPVTESRTVTLGGYLFRDSTLVGSKNSGTVEYLVSDGEKIPTDTQVANVYEGGSSETRELISVIDSQIALLRKSAEESYTESDLSELRQSASGAYYSIIKQLAASDLSALYTDTEALLVALNGLEQIKNDDFSIEKKLQTLYDSRAQILASSGAYETVSVADSGYFYRDVDGYEATFNGAAARELDGDELSQMMLEPRIEAVPESCIGRVSRTADWYFAVSAEEEIADQLEDNGTYMLTFTGGGTYDIEMTLQRRLECKRSGGTVLVFGTSVIPDGFGFERRQTVKIELQSVSGIYVPTTAVHGGDGRRTVYVLVGSVVQKRRIEVIYEGADYLIVRDGIITDDGDVYLQSNEQLITGGSNLFDGRILD